MPGAVRLGDEFGWCRSERTDMVPCYESATGRCPLTAPCQHACRARMQPRQLVSVSSIDVEKLIAECVPGGDLCDPQVVADNIRRYCNAWPTA